MNKYSEHCRTLGIWPYAGIVMSCLAVAFAASGCDRRPHSPLSDAVPAQPPVQAVTLAAWKTALQSVYSLSDKSEKPAYTRFLAHLTAESEGDRLIAFGLHDPFNKVWIFHAGPPVRAYTKVSTYVSIPEQGRPVVFLRPIYWNAKTPLLLRKLSILVEGELALESNCNRVRSEFDDRGVVEYCDIPLSEQQLAALRSITPQSNVQLRLTGREDYAHVEASIGEAFRPLDDFKKKIQTTFAYHDRLSAAVEPHVPFTVPASWPLGADAIERLAMPRTW